MENESPFNSVPPVPLALVLILAAIELIFWMGSKGLVGGPTAIAWRVNAMTEWGFSPNVLTMMVDRGDWSFDLLKRFVTYPFFHYSITHALWAGVLLVSLGKYVGEVYKPLAFIAIFFGSVIFGALAYAVLSPTNGLLVGAYPGVYGLIGAYTYLMWLTLGQMGENQYRAFQLIGVLMGLMLVYSMLFGAGTLWIAELGGFVAGLIIAPLVAPGGWSAFLSRIRRR